MQRLLHGCLALIIALALAPAAHAQPKLVLTQVSSDLAGDGNTVIGGILNANVYSQITTFTRGSGFQFRGPFSLGGDGRLQMSDVNAGVFSAAFGLYNGSFGTPYWPPSNPGLFGNYNGFARACYNGTSCTAVDPTACTGVIIYSSQTCGPRACCNGAVCTLVEPSTCAGVVIYATDGCSPGFCPAASLPALGACCNRTTLLCTVTAQGACVGTDYWLGNLTTCGNYPCIHGHNLPFRYSSVTDSWANCGGIPNNTGGAGQGSSRCDAGIASPYDISASGRFIVGGSWYGAFGTVACGTRGFIYDNNDGSVQMLPLVGTAAGCQNFSQADRVSSDGNVVLGRDMHATDDPSGIPIVCNAGCVAVWERDVATGQFLLPRTPRACCNGASCTVVDPFACPAGSVALAATSCTPNPCPPSPNPPASGACCSSISLNCSVRTQALCASPSVWIGAGACSPRNPCLPATETILDQYGSGGIGEKVITRSGTVVAGWISSGKADYELLDSAKFGDLCKYVKNAGTGAWDFVHIGKVAGSSAGGQGNRNMIPFAISDDGNTIIGSYAGPVLRACCTGSVCTMVASSACQVGSLGYYSPSCTPSPCADTAAVGACCNLAAQTCVVSDKSSCAASNLWVGYGPCYAACGGGGSFIWRPDLNGGVPMNLEAHLQALNGGSMYPPLSPSGVVAGTLSVGQAISSDGNAMLVTWAPPPGSCGPGAGLADLGRAGILYLNGSGIDCQPPVIAGGPYDRLQEEFTRLGIVGNVFVAGSFPMTMQWQRESPTNSNIWVNMDDSCGQFTNDAAWVYEGTHGFQLRINMLADPSLRDGRFRVIATNSCGSATSAVANISVVSGACCFYEAGSIVCTVQMPSRCTSSFWVGGGGGVYLGDSTSCSPTACDTSIGACCFYAGAVQCVADISTHCTTAVSGGGRGGAFVGGGVACTPTACDAVSGACCYSPGGTDNAICTIEISPRCTQSVALGGLNGVYVGNLSACSPTACAPFVGACCFSASAGSDVICSIQISGRCTGTYTSGNLQGVYRGAGTTCTPTQCAPVLDPFGGIGNGIGACCFSDPANPASGISCTIQIKANCINYPNGSTPTNTGPFTAGLGGVFRDGLTCGVTNCNLYTGACYHSPFGDGIDATCTIQPSFRCTRRFNAGGLFGGYAGDNTTCSPATAAAQTGACCYQPTASNGSPQGCVICTIQPQDRCVTVNNGGLSGVYGGPGTSCSPVNECPAQFGACCVPTATAGVFTCVVVARSACTGTLAGSASTSCVPVACPLPLGTQPPPAGACCNTATTACSITTKAACASTSAWIFAGTCAPTNVCAQPGSGACCISTSCTASCPADCAANAGEYRGDGTTCTPDPCAPTAICCRGSTCAVIAPATCTATGAAGAITAVSGACGTSATAPCCYADYNKIGGPNVTDIFAYLTDWFAARPWAVVGGDGTGTPTVSHIFAFLTAWFAGGC